MLEPARKVIEAEAEALKLLAQNIPDDFTKLVERILSLRGRLILSGIGKSGYIARKIAASFASTGTPAMYIHPAEASHGDLGMIAEDDIVILLSNSGETKEIFDIVNYCKRFGTEIVAMTMKAESTLAKNSNYVLNIPHAPEASVVDAPTTSALMMLSLGDALMVAVYDAKGFTKENFKLLHPGGKIGANLLKVADLMHKGDELPVVSLRTAILEALIVMTKKRLGCAIVLDAEGDLAGIITDGDLRRHISTGIIGMTAEDIMSKSPKTITSSCFAMEALGLMNKSSITSLIVTENDKLCGIIHIHDLLKAGVG